jgi:phospholipase D-like protein
LPDDASELIDARTLGSLIAITDDPIQSSIGLGNYLLSPTPELATALRGYGVDPAAVELFRRLFPSDAEAVRRRCQLAAAWALGRLSARPRTMWQPVITAPERYRDEFAHFTSETLVGLIAEANNIVRIFGSFVDAKGMSRLAEAIAFTTLRRITVVAGFREGADRDESRDKLVGIVERLGRLEYLKVFTTDLQGPFAHLKIVIADEDRAYLGSANLTGAALSSNFEVGALVEGSGVRSFARLFDQIAVDASRNAS